MLIGLLTDSVALGGNLIMNVGPTARGCFDRRAEDALKVYADWMRLNGRSIYGCTMAEPQFVAPAGVSLTQSEDGKRLYIHLTNYPFHRVTIEGLNSDNIGYIQLLADGSEVKYEVKQDNNDAAGNPLPDYTRIQLPGCSFSDLNCSVIEVLLK